MAFELVSDFKPEGDQPQAIESLADSYRNGAKRQVLLGVTGSGKTFTMANLIKELNVPTLIMAHNKTLAAQLYGEFLKFFPNNAVEYFVSYYDYYQPEAYIPSSDVYIEKDSSINEDIDKLRHRATRSLLERRDVVVIASVSCIYGIGSPEAYYDALITLEAGEDVDFDRILSKLVEIQYERNDYDFHRGTYRVKGDTLEVFPIHEDSVAYRIEFFGSVVEQLSEFDPITGKTIKVREKLAIFPGSHYITESIKMEAVTKQIKQDLNERCAELLQQNKLVEEQRLTQRTMFDIEMLLETSYCNGIENYSRYFENRKIGEPPSTLLSYLPKDALVIIDESHITLPQVRGMYNGDRSRKTTLVEYGFRLPAALDNRPLRYEEFDKRLGKTLYVSATPNEFEINESNGIIVEQIIRPTGLTDPVIEVRPARTQVDDLYGEVIKVAKLGERTLVTTLTKRMAEELTKYFAELGVRVKYLHSEIDTIERVKILRELRLGDFDALIGINLLREGLDLPEVSLVAVLDADKEGFLRSTQSLIQTVGRAARNVNGRAIFYADIVTNSIKRTIEETNRRRDKQLAYNKANGITPESIKSGISDILSSIYERDYLSVPMTDKDEIELTGDPKLDVPMIEKMMKQAAKELNFEYAAKLRDILFELKSE